ncbi:MAG: type I restriction endonuclease subunit R [Brevinema sp.]
MAYYGERIHEEAAIELLKGLGYTHLSGRDVLRSSSSEVLMISELRNALARINPHLPQEQIAAEILNIKDNQDFYKFLKQGVPVEYQYQGETRYGSADLIDWENPANNSFHVVNQLTITGKNESKRPDVILYVNGLPLVVFELKSPSKNDTSLIVQAYEQLQDYQNKIPQLFLFNAFCVIDDGVQSRVGTTSSDFSRFVPWSSLDGEIQVRSKLETIIQGMCEPARLLDLIRDFTFYVKDKRYSFKILAGWHQYFAVKKALPATEKALHGDHKIGVLWHTQGSGKSFTMAMYVALLARDMKNPTIVVLTDRNDLDEQLYTTFSNAKDHLNNSIVQAESSSELRELLSSTKSGGIFFTTVHKFIGEDRGLIECLSERQDIIVIADEAHRSHYGAGLQVKIADGVAQESYSFAKQVRTALPNASFIGFTGTPIEELDKSTKEVFGENIHVYGLAQSVQDGMTVGISYNNRAAKLSLKEDVLQNIDALYDDALQNNAPIENIEKSKKELSRSRLLYEHPSRLTAIAKDIVAHFETRPQQELKGMVVCSSRDAASQLYNEILKQKPQWEDEVHVVVTSAEDDTPELKRFQTTKTQRDDLALNFKDPHHKFKLAIVVDMWLTGFDVPCLGVMYLDKELEKHNLMQTIARVNRTYPDKQGGLICDYRGIFTKLQEALRIYSNSDQEYFEDYDTIVSRLHTLIEQMKDFFFGIITLDDFLDNSKSSEAFQVALDYLEGVLLQKDEKYREYRRISSKINGCFKICYNNVDKNIEKIVAFLLEINRHLNKMSNMGEYSTVSLNAEVEKLVRRAIEAGDIENILVLGQNTNSGVNILNEDILKRIANIPQKNIAIKTIENLLNDQLTQMRRINITNSKKYSELLRSILLQYENKSLTSAEVLTALMDVTGEIMAEDDRAQKMNMSQEEYAFYCAIHGEDLSRLDDFGPEVLRNLCHELVETVRSSKTIDWSKKDSVRAGMRIAIRRLLKKYKYPPDDIVNATDEILKQAEEQEII